MDAVKSTQQKTTAIQKSLEVLKEQLKQTILKFSNLNIEEIPKKKKRKRGRGKLKNQIVSETFLNEDNLPKSSTMDQNKNIHAQEGMSTKNETIQNSKKQAKKWPTINPNNLPIDVSTVENSKNQLKTSKTNDTNKSKNTTVQNCKTKTEAKISSIINSNNSKLGENSKNQANYKNANANNSKKPAVQNLNTGTEAKTKPKINSKVKNPKNQSKILIKTKTKNSSSTDANEKLTNAKKDPLIMKNSNLNPKDVEKYNDLHIKTTTTNTTKTCQISLPISKSKDKNDINIKNIFPKNTRKITQIKTVHQISVESSSKTKARISQPNKRKKGVVGLIKIQNPNYRKVKETVNINRIDIAKAVPFLYSNDIKQIKKQQAQRNHLNSEEATKDLARLAIIRQQRTR